MSLIPGTKGCGRDIISVAIINDVYMGYEVSAVSNTISEAVSKLSKITKHTPVNWDAFDAVLGRLEDINTYNEQYEETILSEFIMQGDFYNRGAILVDIVRHFLS